MSVGGAPFLRVIWVVGDCCTFVSFNLWAWACYAFVSFNMFVFNSHPRVIQQVGIGHWASCTSMLLNMAVLSSPWPCIIWHSAIGLSHLCHPKCQVGVWSWRLWGRWASHSLSLVGLVHTSSGPPGCHLGRLAAVWPFLSSSLPFKVWTLDWKVVSRVEKRQKQAMTFIVARFQDILFSFTFPSSLSSFSWHTVCHSPLIDHSLRVIASWAWWRWSTKPSIITGANSQDHDSGHRAIKRVIRRW